jgi:hypothetical protein
VPPPFRQLVCGLHEIGEEGSQSRCIVSHRFLSLLAGVLLPALITMPAHAAMRCGHELISRGDSVLKLLEACGEPTVGNPAILFGDVFWIYNFGPDEFKQRIRIRDGTIMSIQRLGRGVEEPHAALGRFR